MSVLALSCAGRPGDASVFVPGDQYAYIGEDIVGEGSEQGKMRRTRPCHTTDARMPIVRLRWARVDDRFTGAIVREDVAFVRGQ
jgi:hypothetical protein